MEINLNKDFLAMLEAPWLKKQIETHLVFGLCSRKVPLGLLFIAICVMYIFHDVFTSKESFVKQLWNDSEYLVFIIGGIYMLKIPKYHQAALGWWTTKGSLVLICMAGIVNYGLVGFFRGSPDAMHVTLMAVIWFPSLEFIPSLTEKQKYLTIARIVVSIPLLILWHRTGTWS